VNCPFQVYDSINGESVVFRETMPKDSGERAVSIAKILGDMDMCPDLICAEPSEGHWLIEEFIEGSILSTPSTRLEVSSKIIKNCAQSLRKFHDIPKEKLSSFMKDDIPWVFQMMTYRVAKGSQLGKEVRRFMQIVEKAGFESRVCHNDFKGKNIIGISPGFSGRTGEVKLIDFEHCGFNFRGFDIGTFLMDAVRSRPGGGTFEIDPFPQDLYREFMESYGNNVSEAECKIGYLCAILEVATYHHAKRNFHELKGLMEAYEREKPWLTAFEREITKSPTVGIPGMLSVVYLSAWTCAFGVAYFLSSFATHCMIVVFIIQLATRTAFYLRHQHVKKSHPKLRVLLFQEPGPDTMTGVLRRYEYLVDYLKDRVDIRVAAVSKSPTWRGVPVYQQSKWIFGCFRLGMLHHNLENTVGLGLHTFQLLWHVFEFCPDVIHHSGFSFVLCHPLIHFFFNPKTSFTYHARADAFADSYSKNWHPFARWLLTKGVVFLFMNVFSLIIGFVYDLVVIVPSQDTAIYLNSNSIWPADIVWSKCVDLDLFHPRYHDRNSLTALLRGKYPDITSDTPVLLHVSRISVEKNMQMLPPIMEALQKRSSKFVVLIVGTGNNLLIKELEAAFIRNGTKYIFAGYKNGEDLFRLYASSSVLLSCSEFETCGFTVMESMACGTPTVIANAKAHTEYEEDEMSVFRFDPGNVQDAANKLWKCLQKFEADEDVVRKRCREHAQKYKKENFCGETLQLWRDHAHGR